ncbi:cation:dicarboxylase symporter family transporter [Sphingomonas sp. MAH-20]|uniref:Cation:dicarboxylase symporter family transporter n=1 Tax=Sphingomonas horti TaxID=2682842 RepID=A0A6I4IWR6_9SPHN|nr:MULTISPECIES: dicarboxylate/amino acid:cation symporter [Sphingomonas]MBA2920208.1 dicarboxylate/amino acid:cation symporter [Sphingomonas sp. CGMCC 1.13658]MVO76463.1 cation:dicarboxylase symporter family transporter [Sphingomonas horti]
MGLLRGWFAIPLWKRVLGALLLGLLFALVWPEGTPAVAFMGELFVRAIRMLVAPIVLVTIAAGITALGDPKRIGGLGGRTIGLFALTTAIAVSVGMAVAALIRPGVDAPLGTAAPHALGPAVTPYDQLIGIVPLNIFDALAKGDMLALIFVAILTGVGTLVAGEAGKPFAALLQSASAVLLRIVGIVMEATPFGVFALIANAVAANGAAVFVNVGWLALAVLIGSLVQIVLVHSLILRLLARVPVLPFFRGIIDALVVAFSTASSSATLPVAMRVAEKNLGIGRPVFSTTLPLGASIGKDGTAMYVGLLSMFSLQAFGVELSPAVYGLVLLTGALAAFGTAPVPSASLFMLAAVLSAVGVAPEQTALVVGFVLPFDRLLDMTRTVPSASANLTVATTVARWEGELDERVYRAAATA